MLPYAFILQMKWKKVLKLCLHVGFCGCVSLDLTRFQNPELTVDFLSSAYVHVLPVAVAPALNASQTELKWPLFLETILET